VGAVKEQWIKATPGSAYAALAYAIVDSVETGYEGEGSLEEILVPGWLLEPGEALGRLRVSPRLRVRISAPGHRGPLGEPRRLENGVVVEVVSDPEEGGEASLADLYWAIPYHALRLDSSLIREGAARTARTGVEYLYVYTDNGLLAFLEGEVHRVSIPFIRAIISLHTHPTGHCGLSVADAKSGIDLLAEGGIAEAAATVRCIVIMRRQGLVLEDDYIAIKSLKSRKNDPFTPQSLNLKSVKIEVFYY
jgi:hypothetical protein